MNLLSSHIIKMTTCQTRSLTYALRLMKIATVDSLVISSTPKLMENYPTCIMTICDRIRKIKYIRIPFSIIPKVNIHLLHKSNIR